MNILKSILPAAAFFLILILPLGYLIIIDRMNAVHDKPIPCEIRPKNSAFCEEMYMDDGLVRIITNKTDRENCCAIEIERVDAKSTNEFLACDALDKSPISCDLYEGERESSTFIFNGRRLTINQHNTEIKNE